MVMPMFEISPGREMSPGELKQLHRGELIPAEVALWTARMRGLTAPGPPAGGDLPPNGTGWLLNVTPFFRRRHPRLYLAVVCCAGAGALIAQWADLLALHRPPLTVAMLLGALVPLVMVALLAVAAHHALRRAFARATRPTCLADAAPGSLVCLTGVIATQASVPTLFRGVPAVLARNSIGSADEVRGIDFEIDLDGSERAWVCVRGAFLVDPPTRAAQAPACGPVYAEPSAEGFGARLRSALLVEPSSVFRLLGTRRESSVGPGDRVEVAGVLHHELAAESADPFARLMPTRFVLRADHRPLLVRREVVRRERSP
jgi:hypothetical protein